MSEAGSEAGRPQPKHHDTCTCCHSALGNTGEGQGLGQTRERKSCGKQAAASHPPRHCQKGMWARLARLPAFQKGQKSGLLWEIF